MDEDVNIPDGYGYTLRRGKIQRFIFAWRNGRKFGFPICCILRFSFEDAQRDGKMIPLEKGMAELRGIVDRGDGNIFVPCNVFHHKTRDN
jgi:hypothetical protein